MLKILKYDWKNGWNNVRSTLVISLIVSILAGIGFGLIGGEVVVSEFSFMIAGKDPLDVTVAFMSIVWFAVMLALLGQTLEAIFRNMTGRMFGTEGYLTHTLPVDTWELLLGKAVGTWIFGVFMVLVALINVMLMFLAAMTSTGDMWYYLSAIVEALPKLGAYHFQQIASGIGYAAYGVLAFLVGSFLVVVQFQFICIAARQFGKYHLAGGIIVFWVLCAIEGDLNKALSMGFLIVLLSSAACFAGSNWLLKHRLRV